MHGGFEHVLFDAATATIAVCSVLHTFLPPWDVLEDFPRAQKVYKVVIYTVGYIAINGRSTVYKGISVGKQVEAAEVKATEAASTTTSVEVSVTKPKDGEGK